MSLQSILAAKKAPVSPAPQVVRDSPPAAPQAVQAPPPAAVANIASYARGGSNPLANLDWQNAQVGGGSSPFLGPGEHHLQVVAVRMGKSMAGTNFFAVDYKVLESTNPEHPVGSMATVWTGLDNQKFSKLIAGDLIGFGMAATGLPQTEIDWTGIAGFADPSQPLQCVEVLANSTLNAKKTFTQHRFSSVPGKTWCALNGIDSVGGTPPEKPPF